MICSNILDDTPLPIFYNSDENIARPHAVYPPLSGFLRAYPVNCGIVKIHRKKCILSSVSPVRLLVTENGSAFLSFSSQDTKDTRHIKQRKKVLSVAKNHEACVNCWLLSLISTLLSPLEIPKILAV